MAQTTPTLTSFLAAIQLGSITDTDTDVCIPPSVATEVMDKLLLIDALDTKLRTLHELIGKKTDHGILHAVVATMGNQISNTRRKHE